MLLTWAKQCFKTALGSNGASVSCTVAAQKDEKLST